MHSRDKFWLGLWTVVIAGFLGAIYMFTTTSMETDKKILEAIKAGADPIAAACAIRPGSVSYKVCLDVVNTRD